MALFRLVDEAGHPVGGGEGVAGGEGGVKRGQALGDGLARGRVAHRGQAHGLDLGRVALDRLGQGGIGQGAEPEVAEGLGRAVEGGHIGRGLQRLQGLGQRRQRGGGQGEGGRGGGMGFEKLAQGEDLGDPGGAEVGQGEATRGRGEVTLGDQCISASRTGMRLTPISAAMA